jgi:polysaccharide export outer membrane protein
MDEKAYSFFNGESSSNIVYEQSAYLYSYEVSDSGFVTIPVIGKVYVSGLTVYQIKDTIQKSIDQYLKGATIIVKLTNFKITVLGEVNHPGTFKTYDNSINVLEAIGLAGDLTTYGNRQKIMIIRQNENNKVYFIDITDRKIIYSNEFYLLPNDIIYVDALKAKAYGFNVFPFATLLSGITTLILLFNYLKL